VDREAQFVSLYEAHAPSVKAYALRRSDPDVADDIVSETFMVAWRRSEDIPPEPRAWLLGVARRVLANQRRSGTRRQALVRRMSERESAFDSRDPSDTVDDGAAVRALERLRPGDREILMLIAWDELSNDEAAEVLGITRNAFAVRLHRARRRYAKAHDAERADLSSSPTSTSEAVR
jgi:RNA polymerase sigma-70 factor (ECF subfamily)